GRLKTFQTAFMFCSNINPKPLQKAGCECSPKRSNTQCRNAPQAAFFCKGRINSANFIRTNP
ncbi:hypothetical protein, partial [Neisseria dentiae]|uniref:hypothetical protein n=1 Tax=Neisseria dentiae TaxID=194197 RepID=UPI0035A02EDB